MRESLRKRQKEPRGSFGVDKSSYIAAMLKLLRRVRPLIGLALAGLMTLAIPCAWSRRAEATEVGYGRNLGLGFVLGDPTGFVGKYWVGRTNAIDMGLGFYGYSWGWCDNNGTRCGGNQSFSLNADYLWQSNLVRSTAQLDWHIGAGARTIIWNDGNHGHVALGPRMPIGLDLMFANPNFLELFFELAPTIYVAPGVGFNIEGGLGVRLYF
jgi:hypothetical protein